MVAVAIISTKVIGIRGPLNGKFQPEMNLDSIVFFFFFFIFQ